MSNLKVLNEIEPMFLRTDEKGNDIYVFKCQRNGCNNFYTAKITSKRTQCGCAYIENGRRQGKLNKKSNPFYFPIGYDFGVCFYDNYDGYFIFDLEYYEFLKENHCTALVNKEQNRVDPIITINGKQVLLARWLMKTPDGLEVDHINHDTNDLRMCNLRNCTKEQNNFNKKNAKQGVVKQREDGKFIIIDFPKAKEVVSDLVFDTREEALDFLFTLQDKYFGEYGSRRSGEMAEKYATDYFARAKFFGNDILDEILVLPERNIYKIMLNEIYRDYKSGRTPKWVFVENILNLIKYYKDRDN